MPVDVCVRMVEASSRACALPLAPSPQPSWDALANSFASLSAAFAWGAIVLAVIAIIAAVAWGKVVTITAEKEAREEAKRCADTYIQNWLAADAPGIIRQHVEYLQDTTLGGGDDGKAADQMGEAAG